MTSSNDSESLFQTVFLASACVIVMWLCFSIHPAIADPLDSQVKKRQNELFLAVQGISLHFENIEKRNAFNSTLGVEYSPESKWGWQAGSFIDSFGTVSGYGGVNRELSTIRLGSMRGRWLLVANLVYKQFRASHDRELRLLPLPVLELRAHRRLLVNVGVVPSIDGGRFHTNGLVFFQFKYKLPSSR